MDFQMLYNCVAKLDNKVTQITESTELSENEKESQLIELLGSYCPDNQFILDIYLQYLEGIANLEANIREKDYQQSIKTETEIRNHATKIKTILETNL
jgi:hypothetical protein